MLSYTLVELKNGIYVTKCKRSSKRTEFVLKYLHSQVSLSLITLLTKLVTCSHIHFVNNAKEVLWGAYEIYIIIRNKNRFTCQLFLTKEWNWLFKISLHINTRYITKSYSKKITYCVNCGQSHFHLMIDPYDEKEILQT